jgi:Fe2+ or Zn2+ uptake regulation protein
MCKVPTSEIQEYIDFLKIVEKRLESHNQLLTINKSIILEILFENSEHLSAEDIIRLSKKKQNNSLKVTTVYRVLGTFETFGIVDSITVDDKKRYELSYFNQPHYHLYCQSCHIISEFESLDIHGKFLQSLKRLNFTPTNFNVIINGICNKCQIQ